jgi:hypothetical protein
MIDGAIVLEDNEKEQKVRTLRGRILTIHKDTNIISSTTPKSRHLPAPSSPPGRLSHSTIPNRLSY